MGVWSVFYTTDTLLGRRVGCTVTVVEAVRCRIIINYWGPGDICAADRLCRGLDSLPRITLLDDSNNNPLSQDEPSKARNVKAEKCAVGVKQDKSKITYL